ncbi:hypothetical protein [Aliiroseovarius marinus]|uniref:hypothetical protein n=1 Tax=Aliiroseovarius marinus TaxID=2500159 RepID=UPI00105F0D8E|nr:hypothetical protein [Aliiroseovarius marinus]
MANWFSKLSLAVLTAVLIYWLTTGLNPDPAPKQPQVTRVQGYVVVPDNSPARSLDELGAGATLCGSKATIDALRASPPLVAFNLRALQTGELFQAYQVGICNGVLFRELAHANAIFPADLAGGRVIEIRN